LLLITLQWDKLPAHVAVQYLVIEAGYLKFSLMILSQGFFDALFCV